MQENKSLFSSSSLFEELCSIDYLRESFKAVKRNKGSHGVDGQSIASFEKDLCKELGQLADELSSWSYKPLPVRRVEIPKPNGKDTRILGVPCIRDRVVQHAIKGLLEPILDTQFSENSYGFRPGRNQQQAVRAACEFVKSGKEYIVDIDLSKFFDTVNQDRLIARLSKVIEDKRIIRLIGMTLRSGAIREGEFITSLEGTVQGSPLSPLLSNFVLDELDKELEKRGHNFCRFADDANIFVKSEKAANRVLNSISTFIEGKLKLKINREKSKIALSNQVKFLGMTIVRGTIAISKASLDKAMQRVKELTPRGTNLEIEKSIKQINLWYVGWANYFSMTNYPSQLLRIEAHIRRRLRARFVVQKKKRRHLYKHLIKCGVRRKSAMKTVFSNRGTWNLSHCAAVEKAYSNAWFENQGFKTKSNEKLKHWFHVRRWVSLK